MRALTGGRRNIQVDCRAHQRVRERQPALVAEDMHAYEHLHELRGSVFAQLSQHSSLPKLCTAAEDGDRARERGRVLPQTGKSADNRPAHAVRADGRDAGGCFGGRAHVPFLKSRDKLAEERVACRRCEGGGCEVGIGFLRETDLKQHRDGFLRERARSQDVGTSLRVQLAEETLLGARLAGASCQ